MSTLEIVTNNIMEKASEALYFNFKDKTKRLAIAEEIIHAMGSIGKRPH